MPPVSVLKPLCGADPGLEENLASVFRQDHPDFEVLLGAADADDPALAVARRVAAAHPHVRSRVVADARRTGANPKVNNLANLARLASHDVLVVSDSNVSVPRGYLTGLCAELAAGAGLVTSPIAAPEGSTAGAALESLQLNTFVMGGAAAITRWTGGVCCIGKSMAFHRGDLDRAGGFEMLSRHLAEDQVLGEEFARMGLEVALAAEPVVNRAGGISVRQFASRHVRWARIRRWMNPVGAALEPLGNPVAASIAACAALPPAAAAAGASALLLFRAACDAWMESRIGVVRPFHRRLCLLVAKETILLLATPAAWLSRDVGWRGRTYRIGPRTRLGERAAATDAGPSLPGRVEPGTVRDAA